MACVRYCESDSSFKSIERIQKYPIVNDSLVLFCSYYQWLKSKNSIIDNTLVLAEETVRSFKGCAQPIMAKKLKFIDNSICNQLERFEKMCPIILEPSTAITNIPKRVYHQTVQPSFKTMMIPVNKTMEIAYVTSKKVKINMSSFVESSINNTNYVLDKTDELLDKYLPENEDSTSEQPAQNTDIYNKAKLLLRKAQRRLYKRTSKQIHDLMKSTMERLGDIQSVIVDFQCRRNSLQTIISQEYLKTVEILKDKFVVILLKYSELVRETQHHFLNFHKIISASASSTVECLLNNALDGLAALNGNLWGLQQMLSRPKCEFISYNVINHTNDTIKEISVGLESFIHNMKDLLKRKLHQEEMIEMTEMTEIKKN